MASFTGGVAAAGVTVVVDVATTVSLPDGKGTALVSTVVVVVGDTDVAAVTGAIDVHVAVVVVAGLPGVAGAVTVVVCVEALAGETAAEGALGAGPAVTGVKGGGGAGKA